MSFTKSKRRYFFICPTSLATTPGTCPVGCPGGGGGGGGGAVTSKIEPGIIALILADI